MEQTLVSKRELESVLCPLMLLQVLHTWKRVLLDFVLDMLVVGAFDKAIFDFVSVLLVPLIKQKFYRIWNWSGKPWGRQRACKQSQRGDPGDLLSKFTSFSLTFVSFLKVVWLTDDEWETQEW